MPRSAIAWPNDKTYVFDDGGYRRLDSTTGSTEQAGVPISTWPGLPSRPDAALLWGGGKAYFFFGPTYVRYDLKDDKVDPEYLPPNPPLTLAANWPGLWPDGVDAAVNWGNGKCLLFKGGQYIRWDVVSDRMDAGYPRPIDGNWPGIWNDGVDDVLYQGGAKAYFFRGDEWRRYDLAADQVDGSGPAAAFTPDPVPPGAVTAARHLTPVQANQLMADLVRRQLVGLKSWTPFVDGPQGIVSPRPSDRVAVEPNTLNGMTFTNAVAAAGFIDNLDQRMLVALYRFARWLNASAPDVSEVLHLGIGHGGGPPNDCHNQGRAFDFSGVVGSLDGTPFRFTVEADWANRPVAASGLRLDSADPTARLLFATACRFGFFECESNGIGPANHWPPPDLGGSGFVIYPDYGGDAALRAAHRNHVHMQIGPTQG